MPEREQTFLLDQRRNRLMAIGGVDRGISKMLAKRSIRKVKTEVFHQKMLSAASKEANVRNQVSAASGGEGDESSDASSSNPDTKHTVQLTVNTLHS